MKVYAQDGVNTKEGDSFSAYCGRLCAGTYGNSPKVDVYDMSRGNFRGPRGFSLKGLPPGCKHTLAPDGIGTKVVAIDASFGHGKAGFDLAAMTAMDITRWGGLPLVFTNVLDTYTIGQEGERVNIACRELLAGLVEAAKALKMVVLNGETAELPGCVSSENPEALVKFNWVGVACGVYHPQMMILGDTLAPGQIIMALMEISLRSNGHSTARKALAMKFGLEWWKNPDAQAAIASVALPSVLYDPFLNQLHGWPEKNFWPLIKMHLIVHVTGGAIEDKFANDLLFPAGFSAELDDLFDPPPIMRDIAGWRGMSDEDCFGTFNCGQGALVVIDAKDEKKFIEFAAEYGIPAKRCGRILETRPGKAPSVIITSKFTGKEFPIRPKPKKTEQEIKS